MDPVTALGAAAAAAQFTGVAIKAIKLTKDICSGVKDAPESIKRHVDQLETLSNTAARVRDNSTLAADAATGAILNECTATVEAVTSLLESVKSSDGDNLAQRGWKAVVGMSREQDIIRLLDDLERTKASLLLHIGTITSSQTDTIIQNQQKHGEGIAAIQNTLESVQIAGNEEQVFLRAMFVTDPRDDREALLSIKGDRVDGTCTWVIDTEAYEIWLNSVCQGLWILGGPGMGKSMMSIFLTQHLEASVWSRQQGTVIYFFCDNRDANKNNAAAVLRGLIWQLAQLRPQLLRHGVTELRSRGGKPENIYGVETLWRIFCSMLGDAEAGLVYCVIDGLDECIERGESPLIEFLSKKEPTSDFKPVILSRPLQSIPARALTGLVRLRLDPDSEDQVNADLRAFIQERVEELSEDKGYPDSLRQLVEQTFAEKSQSTFLWVGFAARELRTVPINDVEQYLASLPSDLSAIYDRIFSNMNQSLIQRVKQVLLLAVVAYRPLTLEEVASLLSIRPSNTLTSLEIVQSVISQCQNLLVIVDGRINLVHQSVKDYILYQPPNTRQPSIGYHIKPQIAHKEATILCLNYLESLPSTYKPWFSRRKTYQEQHFRDHARDSGDELVGIIGRALPFFTGRFLYLHQEPEVQDDMIRLAKPIHVASIAGVGLMALHILKNESWASIPGLSRAYEGQTPLHLAADYGHEHILEMFFEKKRRGGSLALDARDDSGCTPLYLASEKGRLGAVRVLLGHKANPNLRNKEHWTPLTIAIFYGIWRPEQARQLIISQLLAAGADTSIKWHVTRKGEWTPLYMSLYFLPQCTEQLLQAGADPNLRNEDGSLPIYFAVSLLKADLCRLLLLKGANPNLPHKDWRSPLHLISNPGCGISRYMSMIKGIMDAQRDIDNPYGERWEWDEGRTLDLLLEHGAKPNLRGPDGHTPLTWCAHEKPEHSEIIAEKLIRGGADIDAQDSSGCTALHWALETGNESLAQVLRNAGANPLLKNHEGQTAEEVGEIQRRLSRPL